MEALTIEEKARLISLHAQIIEVHNHFGDRFNGLQALEDSIGDLVNDAGAYISSPAERLEAVCRDLGNGERDQDIVQEAILMLEQNCPKWMETPYS